MVKAILPAALAAPTTATDTDREARNGARPNIVFILSDDQRFDAPPLHAVLESPHLDALTAQGVRFSNAFVTSPIYPSSRGPRC